MAFECLVDLGVASAAKNRVCSFASQSIKGFDLQMVFAKDPLWEPVGARKAKATDEFKRRNAINLRNTAHQARESRNRFWLTAAGYGPSDAAKGGVPACPLYLKAAPKRKKGDKKKKITKRINRVLKTHTLNTIASGACGNAAAAIADDATSLRCNVTPENKQCPLIYSLSKPCAMMLDALATAYCQEMFANSVALRKANVDSKGEPVQKKVTVRAAMAGAEALNLKIAGATAYVPVKVGARLAKAATKPAKAAKAAAA